MATGQTWHIGLTLLVPRLRGGRWLCGALIFALLAGFFATTGVFDAPSVGNPDANRSAALFFCLVIAYIVPVFHYISERTVVAIDTLAPDIDPAAAAIASIRERVHRKPRRWFAKVLTIGFLAAVVHNVALSMGENLRLTDEFGYVAMIVGGTLTWVVLTLVVVALIDNAVMLNRLARSVRLSPFSAERLYPFAMVAVLSTLALIGAQALFPIMILDTELNAVAFLPGLVATVVPMIVLAVLPIWPLHRRLRGAKAALLRDVNERIASLPPKQTAPQAMQAIAPLLAWRREIAALPDWPFDIGIVGRLVFYLIIPPLTWVAAALIQHFVEQAL